MFTVTVNTISVEKKKTSREHCCNVEDCRLNPMKKLRLGEGQDQLIMESEKNKKINY